jgi:hypothetical protein
MNLSLDQVDKGLPVVREASKKSSHLLPQDRATSFDYSPEPCLRLGGIGILARGTVPLDWRRGELLDCRSAVMAYRRQLLLCIRSPQERLSLDPLPVSRGIPLLEALPGEQPPHGLL